MAVIFNSNHVKPFTVWLTGLSVSGKTTLAHALKSDLDNEGVANIVLLDGETFRQKLMNYSYTTNDRNAIGIEKAFLAQNYNSRGDIVIITGISHHKETRHKIRQIIHNYLEVYLRCSVEICARRDYKGNYQRAFRGELDNFIGVAEPYQESNSPDLVIETSLKSAVESSEILLSFILQHIDNNIKKDFSFHEKIA